MSAMRKARRARLESLQRMADIDRANRCTYDRQALKPGFVVRLLTGEKFCNQDCLDAQIEREALEKKASAS